MTSKTLVHGKTCPIDFIGFFADQKMGFGPALVRCLVRLVQAGPKRTKISQTYENTRKKADQVWTKTGPSTVLVRSPRFSRKSAGGSGSGPKP